MPKQMLGSNSVNSVHHVMLDFVAGKGNAAKYLESIVSAQVSYPSIYILMCRLLVLTDQLTSSQQVSQLSRHLQDLYVLLLQMLELRTQSVRPFVQVFVMVGGEINMRRGGNCTYCNFLSAFCFAGGERK